MHVNFSLEADYTPTWNNNRDLPEGEQGKAHFSTMETADFLDLMDAFDRHELSDGVVDTDKIDTKTSKELLKEVGRLLPKYVKITNFTLNGGVELTIEHVTKYAPFMQLGVELLLECANRAVPTEADEGNSDAQPA